MSRYCPHHVIAPILEAAEHWRNRGLLNNGSTFTDSALWKVELFQELEKHFSNQPVEGETGFYEKFSEQLEPTAPDVKQLAAEMLWVMLLCPSNIRADKKREGVHRIWRWSGSEVPSEVRWLSDEVLEGVGSSGTSFNTNRWRELTFFIRTMLAFKRCSPEEQQAILANGWQFAQWLETIPECESRQLRHMLLFLLFPDQFERIFGGTDRRTIVAAFTGLSKAQVRKMSALAIDRKLAEIRQQEEEKHDTKELDFYVPPLRAKWKEGEGARTWLFVWNPENWSWPTFSEDRAQTHRGQIVTERWACANHTIAIGDKAYLRKSGNPPRGIIAVGNVVSEPYEDTHWDEGQSEEGKSGWYVDIGFTRIQDPTQYNDPFVTDTDLSSIAVEQQQWAPQSSGIEIKPLSAIALDKAWNEKVNGGPKLAVQEPRPEATAAINLILYGPPGTGKTFQLNKLKAKYISSQKSLSREAWLTQQLLEARWFDVTVAALYQLGSSAKAKAIVEHEFIQLKARAQGRTQNVQNQVWATLQTHTIETSTTVNYKNRLSPQVFDKTPESEWYLVDDWQESCEEQKQMAETWQAGPPAERAQERYAFVTFHQAYSYEDFIEGIRPIHDPETGEVGYKILPGVFRRICQQAKADPHHRYAIFIDEINRGNIAKIFG